MIISLGKPYNTFEINSDIISLSEERYEVGDLIDKGGNAAVHECINGDGDVFAVKFMLNTSSKMNRRFQQEIKALKTILHPHIIKYIDDGYVTLLSDEGKSCDIGFLIMEKADQNLLNFMKNHKHIGYELYAPQFRGLSEALAELHRYAIHRDIKPENILIHGETWLIGDLGLCSYICEDEHVDITGFYEKVGPKFWLSPEAINQIYFGTEEICTCSDVYQLCAVFWFVITYRHPQGIITEADGNEFDPDICKILVKSLSYDSRLRPQNGKELFELMSMATEFK